MSVEPQNTSTTKRLSNYRKLTSLILTKNPKKFMYLPSKSLGTRRQTKDEEEREVSAQLTLLRKKHDTSRAVNIVRESRLELLAEDLKYRSKISPSPIPFAHKVGELEESIQKAHSKSEEALQTTKTYKHMIDRLNADKQSRDKNMHNLLNSIKRTDTSLNSELIKQRRTREFTIHSKLALQVLNKFILNEKQDRLNEINEIEKDVKQHVESNTKRAGRLKKQAEITEAAVNEENNKTALHRREGLLLLRMLAKLLRNKKSQQSRNFSKLEDGISAMQKQAQVESLDSLVLRAWEHIDQYQVATKEIMQTKERVDYFIEQNRLLEQKIHDIDLANPNGNSVSSIDVANNFDLKIQLNQLKIVHQKITEWSSKFLQCLMPFSTHICYPGTLNENVANIKLLVQGNLKRKEANTRKRIADNAAIRKRMTHIY